MRRTTICRSSYVALAVVVALPFAAATTAAQGQGTHVVSRGETLWSISQHYFADPLLWPEIYRRNTAVIEDPHWIYPGEVLELSGLMAPTDTAPTVAQGVPGDTLLELPPEAEGPETIFDRPQAKRIQAQDILRADASRVYRPVRRGEFYSAGFLTEQERIPWAGIVGNTAKPSIQVLADPTVAGRFEEIAILPPAQASYHVGDSLLLARIDRNEDEWGDVVVPVGVARVTAVQPQQVLALVIMQFGRIKGGNLAMPLEPFKDPGNVRPTAVEQGLEGRLIGMRDEHVLAGTQQVVFVDKGRADGVALGDVFEAYRAASEEVGGRSEEIRVQLIVVHTREHTASALVIGVVNPSIPVGLPVRLIKKMPS